MNPTEELIKIYYNVIEMVEEAFEDNQIGRASCRERV